MTETVPDSPSSYQVTSKPSMRLWKILLSENSIRFTSTPATTSAAQCARDTSCTRRNTYAEISSPRLTSSSVVFHMPTKGISTKPVSRLPSTQPAVLANRILPALAPISCASRA